MKGMYRNLISIIPALWVLLVREALVVSKRKIKSAVLFEVIWHLVRSMSMVLDAREAVGSNSNYIFQS